MADYESRLRVRCTCGAEFVAGGSLLFVAQALGLWEDKHEGHGRVFAIARGSR